MKLVKIPIDDIVESFLIADAEGEPETGDIVLWRKRSMMSFRFELDRRFRQMFEGFLFDLIGGGRFSKDRAVLADDAHADLRKQFNRLNYLKSLKNFPKLVEVQESVPHEEVDKEGNVRRWETMEKVWYPEKVIPLKSLVVNEGRFVLTLENGTVSFCESLIDDAIKDHDRKAEEKIFKDLEIRGTWYVRYLRALQRAQEAPEKQGKTS